MSMRFLERLLRTVMLALAGLVTLSIFASIAAITQGDGGGVPPAGRGSETVEQTAAASVSDEGASGANAERPDARAALGPVQDAEAIAEAAQAARRSDERWPEAIAYALLSVAGLLALGLIALVLAVRQLRRIADALGAGRTGASSLP
ncbi:hypothetical protein [Sphingosinicella sp. BN140058]|uniref:hypothetical protein n=1 Tax=Sphingosinicella sp. BN140058 TaxID=1892855 RepID=UPI0010109A67|nr:hypothetical protein [Sphingosinicella sp. BN140058]QAY76940.1 hypothetical protein ETR14_10865 [Sphingosinicella sp. BN140058]